MRRQTLTTRRRRLPTLVDKGDAVGGSDVMTSISNSRRKLQPSPQLPSLEGPNCRSVYCFITVRTTRRRPDLRLRRLVRTASSQSKPLKHKNCSTSQNAPEEYSCDIRGEPPEIANTSLAKWTVEKIEDSADAVQPGLVTGTACLKAWHEHQDHKNPSRSSDSDPQSRPSSRPDFPSTFST
jgi:hypothetical protein